MADRPRVRTRTAQALGRGLHPILAHRSSPRSQLLVVAGRVLGQRGERSAGRPRAGVVTLIVGLTGGRSTSYALFGFGRLQRCLRIALQRG
jgi:hypothetical protein